MTTLVANRQPLKVLSMSNQPDRRPNKRPAAAADFERDGDFQFARKSKRPKADDPEQEPEPASRLRQARPPGRPGRATKETSEDVATVTTASSKFKPSSRSSRRKPNFDASDEDIDALFTRTQRSTRNNSKPTAEKESGESRQNGASLRTRGSKTSRANKDQQNDRDEVMARSPPAPSGKKIAIPMSDTPIINRNKEMRRKGNTNRRSSLGSRGRRASSLIESGQTAIPHREVESKEFYKHIESDGLPEPRRMKQLLTWCGQRALTEKPPHGNPNSNAILGALAIQDQLLKDFASRSEFSNWFSRDDTAPKRPRTLKPNPKNLELDEKLASLEAKIKRLQEEKKAWLELRQPPPEQAPLFKEEEEKNDGIELPDFNLLDKEDGRIRGYLASELKPFEEVRSQTEKRLRKIQSTIEFEVDHLADNMHKLEQRVAVAGNEADEVLSLTAQRLRQREEREKTSSGTRNMPIMEVLRSLGNILPEGDGSGGAGAGAGAGGDG